MEKEDRIKYYKYGMRPILLNVLALVFFLALFAFVLLTFKGEFKVFNGFSILLMLFWFILHEILHYVGFLCTGETKTKDLRMGMFIEKGIFYCMCRKQISKKAILISLLFPLFWIGIVTIIIGYLCNSYLLIMLSIINIAGAIGDILMTIQVLRFPSDIKYFDLDDPTSYYILSKKDLSSINSLGLKLLESNVYKKEEMVVKDKRKIVISKLSKIFLIIFIILIVITLILDIIDKW